MKKKCDKKEKIKKITLHRQVEGVHVSSIVNEGIRALLNFFIFFSKEDYTRTKSTKRIQANKNKRSSIFMLIKTSKRKKVACLAFCAFYAFYAYKKHLRG